MLFCGRMRDDPGQRDYTCSQSQYFIFPLNSGVENSTHSEPQYLNLVKIE